MTKPEPPQPKPLQLSKPSRARWLWLPVLAIMAAGTWYFWPYLKSKAGSPAAPASGARGKKGGPAVIPVVAAKARRGNISVYITGLGSVIPINTVTVKSRVDGQLMKVSYHEGDLVHEGDLLVEIDPRPFQVQLEQAEGQLARDQATLDNARVDFDRYQKLLAQNAIPEQQLSTQKATVAQAEGVVKSDQAQIDSAKLNLVYCNIKSPITGRVGLRLVDPGNIVHASDTNGLVVITQIQPISVIFTVAEDDLQVVLRKLAAGQHLTADAYDRANTHENRQRHAGHRGQPDRSDHRVPAPARRFRQHRQPALPQPVRQCAPAGGGKARRHAGPHRRHPADHQHHLRLRREAAIAPSPSGRSRRESPKAATPKSPAASLPATSSS